MACVMLTLQDILKELNIAEYECEGLAHKTKVKITNTTGTLTNQRVRMRTTRCPVGCKVHNILWFVDQPLA